MSFTPDRMGSEEWNQHPRIEELIDPNHIKHPERLLKGKLDLDTLMGSSGGPSDIFPPELLNHLRVSGLILDVPCGVNARETSLGISTPVGLIANAYGVDPVLEFLPLNGVEGRTLAAYAEDLPFKDAAFATTLSFRGVGWYAGSSFDPYWALREMTRVTAPGGLVAIMIGSGGGFAGINRVSFEENAQGVLTAINRLQGEEFGRTRIDRILDFSDRNSPQINIIVK